MAVYDIMNTVYGALYDICDETHAHCNSKCPVFFVNKSVPNKRGSSCGCDCFMNGKAMYLFLRDHQEGQKKGTVGSSLDSFLDENGILEECREEALKKIK